ncbi:Gfo/Idh/MocA family protein [Streptomyces sp. 6N106]|uniref:Gfo/Idh/MocA family protein n=1 Tax=Streptomyces sp. 6N106 TaxID=3457418 RepID=UPI003FD6A1F6
MHIRTPNATHIGYARAVVEAGLHMVIEKPIATSLSEARELAAAVHAAGTVATVPYAYRYHPLVREIRSRRESGDLGELLLVHGSYLQDWLLPPTRRPGGSTPEPAAPPAPSRTSDRTGRSGRVRLRRAVHRPDRQHLHRPSHETRSPRPLLQRRRTRRARAHRDRGHRGRGVPYPKGRAREHHHLAGLRRSREPAVAGARRLAQVDRLRPGAARIRPIEIIDATLHSAATGGWSEIGAADAAVTAETQKP